MLETGTQGHVIRCLTSKTNDRPPSFPLLGLMVQCPKHEKADRETTKFSFHQNVCGLPARDSVLKHFSDLTLQINRHKHIEIPVQAGLPSHGEPPRLPLTHPSGPTSLSLPFPGCTSMSLHVEGTARGAALECLCLLVAWEERKRQQLLTLQTEKKTRHSTHTEPCAL